MFPKFRKNPSLAKPARLLVIYEGNVQQLGMRIITGIRVGFKVKIRD